MPFKVQLLKRKGKEGGNRQVNISKLSICISSLTHPACSITEAYFGGKVLLFFFLTFAVTLGLALQSILNSPDLRESEKIHLLPTAKTEWGSQPQNTRQQRKSLQDAMNLNADICCLPSWACAAA